MRPFMFIVPPGRRFTMTLAPGISSKDLKIVRGACPHDCPDTCAMLYHVRVGKLIDVLGDPDRPITRGGLCVKLKSRQVSAYPMCQCRYSRCPGSARRR
jgi:anaerobic selenocysteine-containing dehydrogenase